MVKKVGSPVHQIVGLKVFKLTERVDRVETSGEESQNSGTGSVKHKTKHPNVDRLIFSNDSDCVPRHRWQTTAHEIYVYMISDSNAGGVRMFEQRIIRCIQPVSPKPSRIRSVIPSNNQTSRLKRRFDMDQGGRTTRVLGLPWGVYKTAGRD